MLTVSGTVLDVQRKAGGEGDNAYAYFLVSLLVGKASILRVKFDPTRYESTIPGEGEVIDVEVNVSAYNGRQGAALSFSAIRPATLVAAA